jgi:hypothetical protein
LAAATSAFCDLRRQRDGSELVRFTFLFLTGARISSWQPELLEEGIEKSGHTTTNPNMCTPFCSTPPSL